MVVAQLFYGYARVSSKGQERYGNSLEDQRARLVEAGCAPENIYSESFTGTRMERPEFTRLLKKLQPGDTLVVTKLDRFARTAADGAKTIQALLERGVAVNVLNMGKADNSPMGKLMMTIMFAFAEFERDMIVDRTTSGKAVAKTSKPGWREGRKPVEVDAGKLEECKRLAAEGQKTVAECCRELGISRATWYNLLSGKKKLAA